MLNRRSRKKAMAGVMKSPDSEYAKGKGRECSSPQKTWKRGDIT